MAKSSTETYRTNAKSRAKHVRDNSPGGKYAHSKEYKRKHAAANLDKGLPSNATPLISFVLSHSHAAFKS